MTGAALQYMRRAQNRCNESFMSLQLTFRAPCSMLIIIFSAYGLEGQDETHCLLDSDYRDAAVASDQRHHRAAGLTARRAPVGYGPQTGGLLFCAGQTRLR